ncbi:hypothetical protein Tco_0799585 [Tanacetum coccineum]|uniref:Uncharacterized protein n=1 Tax=Tanacetum coccineum TaxID=301880 RepID=A0ABQ4ZU05_9ASTR
MVCQANNLHEVDYDQLYDYLKPNEKNVNASRAKRAARTHDQLALVVNHCAAPSLSHTSSPYYVTYPPFDGRMNVHSKNVGNSGRNMGKIDENSGNATYGQQANGNNAKVQRVLRTSYFRKYTYCSVLQLQADVAAKKDETGVDLNKKENDFLLANIHDTEELEELNATCIMMATPQSVNKDFRAGLSYDSDFAHEVHDSQTSFISDMFAKCDHEQYYLEQTRAIKPTYDDDQIDGNIIFDDPDVEGNSENEEQDNNGHDQKNVKFKLLIGNVNLKLRKQIR